MKPPGPVVSSPDPTGTTEPSQVVHFAAADGTALYGELHRPSRPAVATALVVHGYAEHCGRYREVSSVLSGLGLTTLAFDLRGHGRSAGQRGLVSQFEDYLVDIEAALAELARNGGAGQRVLLVAHSNGALAALRLLADPWRAPKNIAAAVLSSPFLELRAKVPRLKRMAGNLLGRVLPTLSLPLDLDIEILTHDEGKLHERRLDTLCHDVASARWFVGAQATQAWVAEFATRIAIPTLWLIAGGDQLCAPAVAERVGRGVSGAEVHVLAGMHHEVFNEVARADVFALMSDFARKTVVG